MNESWLRTFLAVARLGSMSRASEELFITQPAIKKQLDALENELGTPLLVRTRHGCAVTEAGAWFLEGAKAVCGELDTLRETTRRVGQGHETLGLCVLSNAISPSFGPLIKAFCAAYPAVDLRYVPMAYAERPQAIADGRADVGVYYELPELLEGYGLVFWEMLGAGKSSACWCLLDSESPLAAREVLEVDDLRGVPLATFDARPFGGLARAIGTPMDVEEEPHGVSDGPAGSGAPMRVICGDDFEVLRFCSAGGAYLCSHVMNHCETLKAVPVRYRLPREGLVTRREPSSVVRRFVEVARGLYPGAPASGQAAQ